MAHQGLNDLPLQTVMSSAYTSLCPDLLFLSPRIRSSHLIAQTQQTRDQPILRIGLISTNFYDHSIGRMLVETIIYLNQMQNLGCPDLGLTVNQLQVYVFFIDGQYVDGEINSGKNDQITQFLSHTLGNRFVRLPHDIRIIREVVGGSVDALIFADVGMDIITYLLCHSRLAPVQVQEYISSVCMHEC
jgi:predicted O-linked N-acetylglucosamine transferase (SPINDLY family)